MLRFWTGLEDSQKRKKYEKMGGKKATPPHASEARFWPDYGLDNGESDSSSSEEEDLDD